MKENASDAAYISDCLPDAVPGRAGGCHRWRRGTDFPSGLPPRRASRTFSHRNQQIILGLRDGAGNRALYPEGLVNFRLAVPSVIAAVLGSSLGAKLSLAVSEAAMKYILLAILPAAAFAVLNRHLFRDEEKHMAEADRKTLAVCLVFAFIIGMYDGFYGPGTGTFLIIAFTVFAKMTVGSANAQAKVINLTSNITSLTVFLLNGQVLIPLGIAAAACNMAGSWIGSSLAVSKGAKVVRPVILLVLLILLAKILFNF